MRCSDQTPIRAVASLCLLMVLSACGSSGSPSRQAVADNGSVPPPPTIGETVDGVTYDRVLDSDVDGEAIAFTIHEPEQLVGGQSYPLILHSHGYGGSRQATRPGPDSFIGQFLVNGYGVLSLDERGHNESGGTIRILDPALEGQDWLQTLDWAEENLAWMEYDPAGPDTTVGGVGRGNPVMGAIGGSYGGGYQHLVYAIDPEGRLDALAPDITWFDLRYSLFPGNVFKTFWGTLLSAGGNQPANNQDMQLNEALVQASATNTITEENLELLYQHSLRSHCEGNNPFTFGNLRQIDAFYSQSQLDTLFNLNDLMGNFDCISALGGDVRMMTKSVGHGPANGDGGDNCGSLGRQAATLAWYNEKLLGQAGAANSIPDICVNLGDTGADGIVLDSVLVGGTVAPQASASGFVLQEGSVQIAYSDLYTAPAGGAALAGIPSIELTMADPSGVNAAGDPIVFVGLGIRPAGGANPTDTISNQFRPFRGFDSFSTELNGVTARLAEGDTVVLMFSAAQADQFPGSGTIVATPVDLTADVELPISTTAAAAP